MSLKNPIPVLVSAPHCSVRIPPSRERDYALTERQRLRQADPYTDRIFDLPGAAAFVKARWSRFFIDLNRAPDERDPLHGIARTVDFSGRPVYRPGAEPGDAEIRRRIRECHQPFYEELERALSRPDVLLFLDGHSMEAIGPPLGDRPGQPRADFVLVNHGDENGELRAESLPLTIPGEWARCFAEMLSASFPGRGWTVALNTPFFGNNIARRLADPKRPDSKPGFQLEVSRRLYLDEKTLAPLPGAVETLRRGLAVFIREAAAYAAARTHGT